MKEDVYIQSFKAKRRRIDDLTNDLRNLLYSDDENSQIQRELLNFQLEYLEKNLKRCMEAYAISQLYNEGILDAPNEEEEDDD